MTPRSLFSILIKITGIYIILLLITSIQQFFYTVYILIPQLNMMGNSMSNLIQLILSLSLVAFYGLWFYATIFKTDWVIDKLRLDKGFQEERFELNIHRSTLLKIIVMIIGGMLIIDSFPLLCKDLISYFQGINQFRKFTHNPGSSYIVLYFIKTFIGYFMLTCSRMIVSFIELKSKKRAADSIAGV